MSSKHTEHRISLSIDKAQILPAGRSSTRTGISSEVQIEREVDEIVIESLNRTAPGSTWDGGVQVS